MRTILILLFLTLAAPALATDGVLEINQTCAVQTGCFAGDSPGYPVFIDGQAGASYRLTSNLIVPNENTDGILLNASDIGIDLNNFAIIGAGCVGSTTNCTPTSGTGSGIERTSTLNRGTSVKNGNITGMGNFGVFLGDQAHITNLSVRWNRVDGINTSTGSAVSGNTIYQNGRHGINIFANATVSGNTVLESGSEGIITAKAAVISGNIVSGSGANGINAGPGSAVSGNAVYRSVLTGIAAAFGSVVSDNTAYDNGIDGISCFGACTVSGNNAYTNGVIGIRAHFGSSVQGNTVRANVAFGLFLSSDTSYRENTISNNTAGSVSGGVNAGANVCDGSLTCP